MSQEKFIDRVNKLMALAANAGTPAEAQLAKDKADALILSHQIDRALVGATDASTAEQIKIDVWDIEMPAKFYEQIRYLLGAVMQHCNIRMKFKSWREMEVVGYETDIAYAEGIWVSVYREFAGNLFPTWQPDDTFDNNVYRFVKGGFKWKAIHEEALKHDPAANWGGRYKAAYHRACKARGEEPTAHTSRHEAFRASYANSFKSTITSRLYEMRARARKEQTTDNDKYALAVRTNKEKVDAEFYRLFPQYDPEVMNKRSAEDLERERLRRAALTPKQRAAEDARDEKAYDRARKHAAAMRNKEYDENGWTHGTNIAENVDLSGGKNHITPERNGIES